MTPERFEKLQKVLNTRQDNLTIVMENVHDPHNIAAVMRTCDAVGIQEIYILNTTIPKHKKFGAKTSSSAAKWLTIHQYDNVQDCVMDIRKKYDHLYCSILNDAAVDLYAMNFTKKIALVFGNESLGISENIAKYADGFFVIPQVGMVQSLNISVACAITLYEAFRQKSLQAHYQSPQPTLEAQLLEKLYKDWKIKM